SCCSRRTSTSSRTRTPTRSSTPSTPTRSSFSASPRTSATTLPSAASSAGAAASSSSKTPPEASTTSEPPPARRSGATAGSSSGLPPRPRPNSVKGSDGAADRERDGGALVSFGGRFCNDLAAARVLRDPRPDRVAPLEDGRDDAAGPPAAHGIRLEVERHLGGRRGRRGGQVGADGGRRPP